MVVERHVPRNTPDAADFVGNDSFGCAVEQDHLRSHLEDVLVAAGQFLQHDRAQSER
jgi:hypothetical protein